MSGMPLDTALQASSAARDKAKELGIAVTVSVVDASGRLVLTLRGDGTGYFTTETSRAKASAAAAFGKPTQDIAELQKSNPAFWSAVPSLSKGELLPTAGAAPLKQNGKIIGAIGIGGGTPDHDHQCAMAGAAAVG